MMTVKGFILIVLISYVTASAACDQKTAFKRMMVMYLGLLGLGFPTIMFLFIDMGVFPR